MSFKFGNTEDYFELQPGDQLLFDSRSGKALEGTVTQLRQNKVEVIVLEYKFPVKITVRRKAMIRAIQSEDNRKLLKYNFSKIEKTSELHLENLISDNNVKTL